MNLMASAIAAACAAAPALNQQACNSAFEAGTMQIGLHATVNSIQAMAERKVVVTVESNTPSVVKKTIATVAPVVALGQKVINGDPIGANLGKTTVCDNLYLEGSTKGTVYVRMDWSLK